MPSQEVVINGKTYVAEVEPDGKYSSITEKVTPVVEKVAKTSTLPVNIFDVIVDELVLQNEDGSYDFSLVNSLKSFVESDVWVQGIINNSSSGFTLERLNKFKSYLEVKVQDGDLTAELGSVLLEKIKPLEDQLS